MKQQVLRRDDGAVFPYSPVLARKPNFRPDEIEVPGGQEGGAPPAPAAQPAPPAETAPADGPREADPLAGIETKAQLIELAAEREIEIDPTAPFMKIRKQIKDALAARQAGQSQEDKPQEADE